MKIDKAYCNELKESITPYLARELYFDEESEYYGQKLNFSCDSNECSVELVGVNIYNEKKPKKALHYRTKKNLKHSSECDYFLKNSGASQTEVNKKRKEEGFKITRYPSEFLLNRPKTSNRSSGNVKIEEYEEEIEPFVRNIAGSSGSSSKESVLKTSSLENMVDCYLHGDFDILNNQNLTIGNKTKKFMHFFKKIKYYQDEIGLIYWGNVKEIKKYGKNYRIVFKDRPTVDNISYSVSIYIENELIEKYRKRKLFRSQIDSIIDTQEEVLCFFVGTYPQFIEVEKNKEKFKVLGVTIDNLDHIAFTFGV
ncbi:hypothetical protein [Sporomusa sp. KB1]|uniref:hypothetical protein n=1 Tax=Sporomusa sp. KB1 TaxID=943346 RepID=UPI00119CB5AF|nr:hypothetical protein [Sporomusa sp. KB1]TWH46765.1 hypothetical protein Salpa_2779 [Sporomusa sp. KB1]